MKYGEYVGNLIGYFLWIIMVDWNDMGEYLLSGVMDGKVKVWLIECMVVVVIYSEMDKVLWVVWWLLKIVGKSEMFCIVGVNWSIFFYREVIGGQINYQYDF